jgi:PAS domain S-box-containing protein
MLEDISKPPSPNGLAESFLAVFAQSRIPMALVDRDRRYVEVNDALIELYEYPRSEIVGSISDSMVVDESDRIAARWEKLIHTSHLYGDRVIKHANGTQLNVSYAAHGTTLDGRWVALVVTLSARFQPDGPELIGSPPPEPPRGAESKLTTREREVVRHVALGSNTRRIAAELSLSPDTVRSHVRNAMAKTGAHTRAHLVALVLADGLISE